ncbi:MAG TPA: cation diffusion facilitator family transporter [Anaerolineae bacterium]|nr:cation diffusion facilitator family transporter [Anaerolineae bacterium]
MSERSGNLSSADHDQARHEPDHDHPSGLRGRLAGLFGGHTHDVQAAALDPALWSRRGIRAVKVSLAGLMLTALFQVAIVAMSGSVALLADTIHNFSDALTSIPLWLAFSLSRRERNRRYTYGYGRAEDLAGAFVVLVIFASALIVLVESIQKMIHPQPIAHLGWVAAAAIIGFAGNEIVALFRIRIGRQINSTALVADGLHSRADGFTSLGVLAGALGVALGFPVADPLVGIAIGIVILGVAWGAAREIGYRLMDAVDPAVCDRIESTTRGVAGVMGVHEVAVRWVGHRQRAEVHIVVDGKIPTSESHQVAEAVRHALFHALPALVDVTVHIDPSENASGTTHKTTEHHHP